jgi:hypothetical protein
MPTMNRSVKFVDLAPDSLFLEAIPTARHKSLLAGYLTNWRRGRENVRKMIVDDFWLFQDLGARERAADLLLVWKMYLSECTKPKNLV